MDKLSVQSGGFAYLYANSVGHVQNYIGLLFIDSIPESSVAMNNTGAGSVLNSITSISMSGGSLNMAGSINSFVNGLNISGGTVNLTDGAVNTIYNGITVSGGTVDLRGSTNTISGTNIDSKTVTVSGSGTIYFDEATTLANGVLIKGNGVLNMASSAVKTITGGVVLTDSGQANLSSGTNNTINGGLTLGGSSSVNFSQATNTINDGVMISGGTANFSASNTTIDTLNIQNNGTFDISNCSGTATASNITTVNLDGVGTANPYGGASSYPGGMLIVGGPNATNNIETLNWSGGTLGCVYSSHETSFGSTVFDDVNITDSVNVALLAGDNSLLPDGSLPGANPVYPLFTVGSGQSIATEQITVLNTHPFVEVTSNGVYQTGDTVYVGIAPTTTLTLSDASSQVADTVSSMGVGMIVTSIANGGQDGFMPSVSDLANMRASFSKALRGNTKNPWEALISAYGESADHKPHIMKFKGNYRIWASPYVVNIRNAGSAGAGTAFMERDYGMLVGVSHFLKRYETGVTGVFGFGLIRQQMDANITNKTQGKQVILGLTAARTIRDVWDISSSLYGVGSDKDQYRAGKPTPTTSYLALAQYRTLFLSWQNEMGRVFRFKNGFSLRPCLGTQVGISKRSAFTEKNAGVYAHSYRAQISRSGEGYAGLGVRKKWESDKLEGKLTFSYQLGQRSGNGKARTTVTSGSQNLSLGSTMPGRLTQYINIYGSILNKESNWKIVPGVTFSTQEGQRSLTTSLKVEHRF